MLCRYTFLVFVFLAATLVHAQRPPAPAAHAHNDYVHTRPLLDALDNGFVSVEADIHLVDGKLLVAHDIEHARPERTLEALYLGPLSQRVKKNNGHVYPNGGEFLLLIDLKSEAEPTYAVLAPVLAKYSHMLTRFEPAKTERGAVTVILSGNRPTAKVAAEPTRWVGIDGRLSDLTNTISPHLIPLISDNWAKHFQWKGTGEFPDVEKQKLRGIVTQVHDKGCKLRFWATPDQREAWQVLRDAGVDLLNTDDLVGMNKFLNLRASKTDKD